VSCPGFSINKINWLTGAMAEYTGISVKGQRHFGTKQMVITEIAVESGSGQKAVQRGDELCFPMTQTNKVPQAAQPTTNRVLVSTKRG
jgi:hypothetical protein